MTVTLDGFDRLPGRPSAGPAKPAQGKGEPNKTGAMPERRMPSFENTVAPALVRDENNPCRPRHFKPSATPTLAEAEAPVRHALDVGRTRLLIVSAMFALAFLAIALRLCDVTLLRSPAPPRAGARPALLDRADIVDRNGTIVATSLSEPSLFANPRQITNPADVARQLVQILPGLNLAEVTAKLSLDKGFVWIKHQLTPTQEYNVNKLGMPALQFEPSARRVYPNGPLAAHITGYSGQDNVGLAGIERSFDQSLKGSAQPLTLSVDMRLQHIMHEELERSMAEFQAIGAMGLCMDVNTGEILTMVSLPDFDPNKPGTSNPNNMFNRATLGVYEMGSTFKLFNTAMMLESKKGTMTSTWDATHPLTVGRFTIHDDHPKSRYLSTPEVFIYSSNIGAVKMAESVGIEGQKAFMDALGLLKPAVIELPEVGAPIFPRDWKEVNLMTIAFGHGISVSPMQVMAAAGAVVNGGILRPTTLLKQAPGTVVPGWRIMSQTTSDNLRKMMRLNVLYGTATRAAVPGYLTGGKTGTAEKVQHRGYNHHVLLSNFVGAFPMNAPRYLVMVVIDEPKGNKASGGYATGGMTAGPAFARFVARAAPLLGVNPVDENSPEMLKAMQIDSLVGKKIAPY